MTNRLDETLRFHQTALNARAYRQQVIASNIANADTPNFKARDVDFREALAGALGGATSGPGPQDHRQAPYRRRRRCPLEASLKYRRKSRARWMATRSIWTPSAPPLPRTGAVPSQRDLHQRPAALHADGRPGPVRSP